MGLTSCNVCNKEMAMNAKSCPHCGAPNQLIQRKRKRTILTTSIILIITISIIGMAIFNKNAKPSGMNDNVYNLGIATLEIVDDFLDTKITDKEAEDKLESIQEKLDTIDETDALIISSRILNLEIDIFLTGSYDNVVEGRNDLAEYLNQEKR